MERGDEIGTGFKIWAAYGAKIRRVIVSDDVCTETISGAADREKLLQLLERPRLFSVLYSRTLHVGRVLSPTLAMAVVREAEIAAFVQESGESDYCCWVV